MLTIACSRVCCICCCCAYFIAMLYSLLISFRLLQLLWSFIVASSWLAWVVVVARHNLRSQVHLNYAFFSWKFVTDLYKSTPFVLQVVVFIRQLWVWLLTFDIGLTFVKHYCWERRLYIWGNTKTREIREHALQSKIYLPWFINVIPEKVISTIFNFTTHRE